MEPERASFHFRSYSDDSFLDTVWTERRSENKLNDNILVELKDAIVRSVNIDDQMAHLNDGLCPILILDESVDHQCCQYFLSGSGRFIQVQAIYPWLYTEKLNHRIGLTTDQIKEHTRLRLLHAKGLIDSQGNRTELGLKVEQSNQERRSQSILDSTARRKQNMTDKLKCLCNNPGDRKVQDKIRDKLDPDWRFTSANKIKENLESRQVVALSDLDYWKRVDMGGKH